MSETAPYRRIGIVGSGRVARALGCALGAVSRQPLLLWSRNPAHARDGAAAIGRCEVAGDIAQLSGQCDAVLIAVSDDAVAEIASRLADGQATSTRRFAFHVSGRSGTGVLAPLRQADWRVAAIHPAMTFTGDLQADVRDVKGAHFAVTAPDARTQEEAGALVTRLGGHPFPVSEEDRILYHAALCHVANHLVTLVQQASRMLDFAGVDAPHEKFAPLARAALENSLEKGFAALSGPLLRGDAGTVAQHVDALHAKAPDLEAAYRAMARATVEEMARSGLEVDPRLRKIV